MNPMLLISALLILLIAPQAQSLFDNTTTNNFTITGLSYPVEYAVVDGSGSFMAWNSKGEITMSYMNGTSLCKANFSLAIGQVIWPTYYYPIVLLDDGSMFMIFNTSTCRPQQNYSMEKIANQSGEVAQYITYKLLPNNVPTVAASGILGVY